MKGIITKGTNARLGFPWAVLARGGSPLDAYAANGVNPATYADFANEKYLGTISSFSDFDFSRASEATYTDSNGVQQTAGIDVARRGHHILDTLGAVRERLDNSLVDFIGLGDSNQLLTGYGWDHGVQYALLNAGYPMHATGILTQNENNGSGAGTGYGFNRGGGLVGAVTGAPPELADYLAKGEGGLFPSYYLYGASGVVLGATASSGLYVDGTTFDVTAPMRFDVHYGTFDSGAGSFKLSARINQSPWWTMATSALVSTNTGSFGMDVASLTIPAATFAASDPVNFRLTDGSSEDINGPAFMTWMRAYRTDLSAGWSYNTLDAQGGQSTRTVAYNLQQASNATLTSYFSAIRDGQGTTKTVVMCVNEGLNDRNETLTSVGPGAVSDGSSPEAFVDNFTAIQLRVEQIWALNGWSTEDLFWLVYPSHPISDPDDAELVAYRAAISAYIDTQDRMQFVDLSSLTNETEMLSNGWYASGGADRNHLTQAGYEGIGTKLLSEYTAQEPAQFKLAGVLLEPAATNLLLNSGTLSTQDVTTTAQAYTLSFTGTGTVTLSGTSTTGPLVGTGTGENNRVNLTFTPTTGTLTLTVSGTVTNAQLETGSVPTSYIQTAGTTATRAADQPLSLPSSLIADYQTLTTTSAELVSNGTFDTDTTGWAVTNGTIALSSNAMLITNTADYGTATQTITTTPGSVYYITSSWPAYDTAFYVEAHDVGGRIDLEFGNSGSSLTMAFVARETTTVISAGVYSPTIGLSVTVDNISVKEVEPLVVGFVLKGYVTGSGVPLRWYADANNYITATINSSGDVVFEQADTSVVDNATSAAAYTLGVNVPFSVAGRFGSTFVQGAVDGTANTENATPTTLFDGSALPIQLAYAGGPLILSEFGMWVEDIGQAGIEEGSTP